MKNKTQKQSQQKKTKKGEGKDYTSPSLTRYGNLKKLTSGVAGAVTDGAARQASC